MHPCPIWWCPYVKKGGIWPLRHTQGDDDVKTQGEDGRLQAQERGLEWILPTWSLEVTSPADASVLGCQLPKLGDNKRPLRKLPNRGISYSSVKKLIRVLHWKLKSLHFLALRILQKSVQRTAHLLSF